MLTIGVNALLALWMLASPLAMPGPRCSNVAAGFPVIAVGGTGDHPFEKPEHAAHAIDPVEGGDEMHFRGAGVGEADIDAAADQSAHQAFRAVHEPSSVTPRALPELASSKHASCRTPLQGSLCRSGRGISQREAPSMAYSCGIPSHG